MTVESLNARRADKSGDCRDWSVEDALKDALEQVQLGNIKSEMVYVAFSCDCGNDRREFVYKCAGGTKLELIGLLARHLHIANQT